MNINEEKLNQLLGKFVTDFGATFHAGLVVIGENLGLYKAMADGPLHAGSGGYSAASTAFAVGGLVGAFLIDNGTGRSPVSAAAISGGPTWRPGVAKNGANSTPGKV